MTPKHMQAFDAFVKEVRNVPTVEQVCGHTNGDYLHTITYMSESSLQERFAVYEVEQRMYERFPQLRLEFDVIDRKGHAMEHDDLTHELAEFIRELPDRL